MNQPSDEAFKNMLRFLLKTSVPRLIAKRINRKRAIINYLNNYLYPIILNNDIILKRGKKQINYSHRGELHGTINAKFVSFLVKK